MGTLSGFLWRPSHLIGLDERRFFFWILSYVSPVSGQNHIFFTTLLETRVGYCLIKWSYQRFRFLFIGQGWNRVYFVMDEIREQKRWTPSTVIFQNGEQIFVHWCRRLFRNSGCLTLLDFSCLLLTLKVFLFIV